jgi:hypothetical protein
VASTTNQLTILTEESSGGFIESLRMDRDWSAPDVQQWQTEALQLQEYFNHFVSGKACDRYLKSSDMVILRMKVAFAMFGLPSQWNKNVAEPRGYNEQQKARVNDLCQVIVDHLPGDDVLMSYILICGKMWKGVSFTQPVFYVLLEKEDKLHIAYYVDKACRIYSNWDDYLSNNNLPPNCLYCCPTNGCYASVQQDGSLSFDEPNSTFLFRTSASCEQEMEMVSVVDDDTSYALLLAELDDPDDPDDYDYWSNVRSRILQYMPDGVFKCMLVRLSLHYYKTGYMTELRLHQFITQFLFYTNGFLDIETINSIIKQEHRDVLQKCEMRLNSDEQKLSLHRLAEETHSSHDYRMQGHLHIIKGITRINNIEEFFQHLFHVHSESGDSRVTLEPEGLAFINKQLKIHPRAFMQMLDRHRFAAFNATRKFAKHELTSAEFLGQIQQICQQEHITFEHQRVLYMQYAANGFGVQDLQRVTINGCLIFCELKPFEIDRLTSVLKNAGNNYDQQMIQIVKQFAEHQKCKNASEFCTYVEYTSKFIADNIKPAKNQSRKDCKVQIMAELADQMSPLFASLHTSFEELYAKVAPVNESSLFKFKCNKAATYHYHKHKAFKADVVEPDKYFELARDLFGNDSNRTNTSLQQEGEAMKMTYKDPQRGLFGVLVQPHRLAEDSALFVTTMYYDKTILTQTTCDTK